MESNVLACEWLKQNTPIPREGRAHARARETQTQRQGWLGEEDDWLRGRGRQAGSAGMHVSSERAQTAGNEEEEGEREKEWAAKRMH